MIIIEGRLMYNYETVRNKIDFKLFLDTDCDIMLSRRVYKNIARGKALDSTIKKYNDFVKPSYEKYVEPCKRYADMNIHNFGGNTFDDNSKKTTPVIQMLIDLVGMRINNISNYKRKISADSNIMAEQENENDTWPTAEEDLK